MPAAGRPTPTPTLSHPPRPRSSRWDPHDTKKSSCRRVILPSGQTLGSCNADDEGPPPLRQVNEHELSAKNVMMPDRKEWATNTAAILPKHTFQRQDYPDIRGAHARASGRVRRHSRACVDDRPGGVSSASMFHRKSQSGSVSARRASAAPATTYSRTFVAGGLSDATLRRGRRVRIAGGAAPRPSARPSGTDLHGAVKPKSDPRQSHRRESLMHNLIFPDE
eukprot:m.178369 g.178369  ORF g.178369 m.178369 type:complete len:222 (-) comp24521_c0_seq6:70-735(-)